MCKRGRTCAFLRPPTPTRRPNHPAPTPQPSHPNCTPCRRRWLSQPTAFPCIFCRPAQWPPKTPQTAQNPSPTRSFCAVSAAALPQAAGDAGNTWKHMETRGNSMETRGNTWKHVETSWKHVETRGNTWKHHGNTWKHVETPWKHVETRGNIFLKII